MTYQLSRTDHFDNLSSLNYKNYFIMIYNIIFPCYQYCFITFLIPYTLIYNNISIIKDQGCKY
jgi:hypothetical protein